MSEIPKKRYRLSLEVDAHDMPHLARILEEVARDAEIEGLPSSRISGGGYHFHLEDRGPGLTPDEYDDALLAWFSERRLQREAT